MKAERTKRTYSSQVLNRLVTILSLFSEQRPQLTFKEIQQALRLHKSTLYRLLEAMRAHDWVTFDEGSGTYRIGLTLFGIGNLAVEPFEVADLAKPVLKALVAETGETAHLCILDGTEVVYVCKIESHQMLRIPSSVGRRNPAYCTGVGKSILAFLPEGELSLHVPERLVAFTPRTLTSRPSLLRDLALTRERGYALDRGEIELGIRCVGAPVFDRNGRVAAGISVTGPASRLDQRALNVLAAAVGTAAARLSSTLGHTSPAKPQARPVKGKSARLRVARG